MLLYIAGGAGSGKSAFAESQIVQSGLPAPLYIATMEPFGPEAEVRIARHRALRAGKGFTTVERPRSLETLPPPPNRPVLLEDLTNLFANEWFSPAREGAADRILTGLRRLKARTPLSVIVGNDLFSDGMDYPPDTLAYLQALAALIQETAALSDQVYEVVCGIPLRHK